MLDPNVTLSDTLTSATHPSLVDDGFSLSRRMPCGKNPDAIDNWLSSTIAPPVLPSIPSSSGTIYTGSFIDDGADMLYPTQVIPGFGVMDKRFYGKGKPRKSRHEEEWTVEKERALAGDMWRSLAIMRSIARVELSDADKAEKRRERKETNKGKVGAVEDDGRVRIMKPLMWGTIIIEGDDGRVVVVDREGDYDSGKPKEKKGLEKREKEHAERERGRARELEKALQTTKKRAEEKAKSLREREEMVKAQERSVAKERNRMDKHNRHGHHQSFANSLTPIPEADTLEESTTSIASPTTIFMIGPQSDWFPTAHVPTEPSAAPPSPTESPPGAWPSPQLSPVKFAPSVMLVSTPRALSTITSVTDFEEPWNEQKSWVQEASAFKLPSSASSVKYSDATSSTVSEVAPQDSRGKAASSIFNEDKPSGHGSSKGVTSVSRSRTGSIDSWKEDVDKRSARGSPKRATSSGFRSNAIWSEDVDRLSARDSSRRRKSGEASWAGLNDNWKRDVDTSEGRVSHTTTRSPIKSPIASISTWIQDDGNKPSYSAYPPSKPATSWISASTWDQNEHHSLAPSACSHKSGSRSSVVTPYSWRRQVEEVSDHSTVGSNESRAPAPSRAMSPMSSEERGSDGEGIEERDEDTHSVKTHSTYQAPTVEDAPESDDGALEWDSAWSMKADQKDDEDSKSQAGWKGDQASVAGSAKWSGKTGWGGDIAQADSVTERAAGATTGDWNDKSGYEEGNDTWLNAEVGGVKFREAAWKREPPEGSWRDV
ncbi:uncharacterized protein N0V89_010783 [Didymosphaeria variabile]|uniref:Uncharacterized protein n=1 Tax=Didymosphaeria variabile TaxID=1932322 RepID=A0A9W9C6H0_9PLEO|nr:uncharacterized protein N0V89_010783 [Didymosphaeria variabile]KAJ4346851.1 hypothetical protein N0V89_010783 [Didymosphaeria variabile]